jgi:uncharacterized cupin superfamily protein
MTHRFDAMSEYTKINLSDVTDFAPQFGMEAMGEARFARQQLGAEKIGLTYYKMNGGNRVGFGHTHSEVEEAYVVLSGSGRFKVQDDILTSPRGMSSTSPRTRSANGRPGSRAWRSWPSAATSRATPR